MLRVAALRPTSRMTTFELQFKNRLKFSAQPTPLFLIPTERFANFTNCAPRKFQAVGHVLFFN